MPLSDNLTAIVLSLVALAGNVIVAWISHRRALELQDGIDNANDHPKDVHVVELLKQNETLHSMVKKLLISKGRKEQIAIQRLGDFVAPDDLQKQPPSKEAYEPRPRRHGVIRRKPIESVPHQESEGPRTSL